MRKLQSNSKYYESIRAACAAINIAQYIAAINKRLSTGMTFHISTSLLLEQLVTFANAANFGLTTPEHGFYFLLSKINKIINNGNKNVDIPFNLAMSKDKILSITLTKRVTFSDLISYLEQLFRLTRDTPAKAYGELFKDNKDNQAKLLNYFEGTALASELEFHELLSALGCDECLIDDSHTTPYDSGFDSPLTADKDSLDPSLDPDTNIFSDNSNDGNLFMPVLPTQTNEEAQDTLPFEPRSYLDEQLQTHEDDNLSGDWGCGNTQQLISMIDIEPNETDINSDETVTTTQQDQTNAFITRNGGRLCLLPQAQPMTLEEPSPAHDEQQTTTYPPTDLFGQRQSHYNKQHQERCDTSTVVLCDDTRLVFTWS